MKISELEPNSKVVNLVFNFDVLEEKKESTNGVPVQEGVISDETGQAKITLWADYAGKFKQGDKAVMSTGWCKEFEGALIVSTGKFGKINLVPN